MNTNSRSTSTFVDMKLASSPFESIANGTKTVEIRLFDEKRKSLKVGDLIIFSRLENPNDKILCEIKLLKRFDSFQALFESDLFEKCGCEKLSVAESVGSMRKYYSESQEKQFGVLAIELLLIPEAAPKIQTD